jgi:uncharacterized protein
MILYEWDDHKNDHNINKHGLGFGDASRVFESASRYDYRRRIVLGEVRESAMAEVDGEVLMLVYTYRKGRVRCISFRKAKRKERQVYYASLQQ